jgi:hypothetical protein
VAGEEGSISTVFGAAGADPGALIDAGLPLDALKQVPRSFGVEG